MLLHAFIAAVVLTAPASPRHLVVLTHGLYGGAANLIVLEQKLQAIGGPTVLVHRAQCNEGQTRDGVAAGGRRLAEEVKKVAASHPSLQELSLVGNSLGGLYVRYAARELLDHGRMAGLEPHTLVTTGCPHLGVRRYTWLPLPSVLHPAGKIVAGATADDLLLRDSTVSTPLLVEMSAPDSDFGAALRAFRRRRLYANVRGDFMVPFGTAALETGDWAAGVNDGALAKTYLDRPGASFRDDLVCRGLEDGVAAVWEGDAAPPPPSPPPPLEGPAEAEEVTYEERMRCGLEQCGPWSKAAVAFRTATTLTPFAHNRLVALRREGWRRGFEFIEQAHVGERVCAHCAQYILERER